MDHIVDTLEKKEEFTNMIQHITIKIEAFNTTKINKFLKELITLSSEKNIQVIHNISLPSTKKVYTVLRSPHIDKKSREQFEIRTHSKLVKLIDHHELNNNEFMSLLKDQLSPGVALKIKLTSYENL